MARILVVDDSPIIADAVEQLVRDFGHRVHVESEGLGALCALHTFDPDVMLLDVRLLSVNGFELLAMIRQMARYARLPIVMMSGLTSETDAQRALNFGADGYITKPINHDVLLAVTERAIHHRSR